MNKEINVLYVFIPFFLYVFVHFAVGVYASVNSSSDRPEAVQAVQSINPCLLKCLSDFGGACVDLVDLEEVICE